MSRSEDQSNEERDREFNEALQQFETAVEVPFVPGELVRWIDAVEAARDSLDDCLRRRIESVHAADFAEIQKEDPGLLQRVEQMQETDEKLIEQFDGITRQARDLSEKIRKVEPDEAKLRPELNQFVKSALQFVIAVRRQETALRTWLLEAINRDRGDVD